MFLQAGNCRKQELTGCNFGGGPAGAGAILIRMRLSLATAFCISLGVAAFAHAQTAQPSFDVASVRPSAHQVGPDYNNQITSSASEFNGRNVTLRRLIAEAWHCQLRQVIGPSWLDQNEYDISTRTPKDTTPDQIPLMLRTLLADRFHLREHSDTRQMRAYELTVAAGGPKIKPASSASPAPGGPGFHFRGDMRHFADLLAIQFSIPAPERPDQPVRAGGTPIPVLDKTGLDGEYDFTVDIRPEPGTDAFTGWKRVLEDQLGLKIESRKTDVPVVVVDDVAKIPSEN